MRSNSRHIYLLMVRYTRYGYTHAAMLPKDFHELEETKLVFSGNIQTMVDHYRLAEAT